LTNNTNTRDRRLAIVTACISVVLIAVSFSYPPQSSGFPRVLSVVLLGLSLVLLWNRRSAPKSEARDGVEPSKAAANTQEVSGDGQAIWRSPAFWMFMGTLAYAGAISILGFFTASFLFLLGSMLFLGERRLLMLTLYPIGLCALIYFIFRVVLRVAIPSGYFI
jgi:putative tricarboxylic transport membrane protein